MRQFLADREEAGKNIDVENCELSWHWGQTLDPYGVYTLLPEEKQIQRNYFVRSSKSCGWVHEDDLPPDIFAAFRKALPALMQREDDRFWELLD